MDKVLKIICSQTTANYRKPTAIDVQETFYLPPYSTVIGMIHKACGFDRYHRMRVSVQGAYSGSYTDMYTRYFFGISYDPERHTFFTLNEKGGKDGVTRGRGYAETLTDVNLVIHVLCEEEGDAETVESCLKKPTVYPALGRHEDLLRIDSVEFVEVERTDAVSLNMDAYVPYEIYRKSIQAEDSDKTGVLFNLNKAYTVGKAGFRDWEKVRTKYFTHGFRLSSDDCDLLCEKETGIGVFLA